MHIRGAGSAVPAGAGRDVGRGTDHPAGSLVSVPFQNNTNFITGLL
jgi:hypothetical protein